MCCSCCVSLLNFFNRIINFILCIAGLCVFSWGMYLFSLAEWQPQATIIIIISTGFVLALTTGIFSVVGHKKPTYITVYKVMIILLILFNIVLACACLIPELQDDIIDEVTGGADKSLKAKLKSNIILSGYILAGITVLEILSLVLGQCRRNDLLYRKELSLNEEADSRYEYQVLENGKRTKSLQNITLSVDDDPDDLRSNYQKKYAHLYEKYGIKREKV